jgi:hypothetical protein
MIEYTCGLAFTPGAGPYPGSAPKLREKEAKRDAA